MVQFRVLDCEVPNCFNPSDIHLIRDRVQSFPALVCFGIFVHTYITLKSCQNRLVSFFVQSNDTSFYFFVISWLFIVMWLLSCLFYLSPCDCIWWTAAGLRHYVEHGFIRECVNVQMRECLILWNEIVCTKWAAWQTKYEGSAACTREWCAIWVQHYYFWGDLLSDCLVFLQIV